MCVEGGRVSSYTALTSGGVAEWLACRPSIHYVIDDMGSNPPVTTWDFSVTVESRMKRARKDGATIQHLLDLKWLGYTTVVAHQESIPAL